MTVERNQYVTGLCFLPASYGLGKLNHVGIFTKSCFFSKTKCSKGNSYNLTSLCAPGSLCPSAPSNSLSKHRDEISRFVQPKRGGKEERQHCLVGNKSQTPVCISRLSLKLQSKSFYESIILHRVT